MLVKIDRGEKVKIKNINFNGNEKIKGKKLRKAMKNTKQKNDIKRLVNFIDICYDEKIKLIIYAEKNIEEILPQGIMQREIKRTISRIREICSC